MKAIVISDNNYRGQFVDSLLKMDKQYIRKFVKGLIAEGKAEVFVIENPKGYHNVWLKLGEIVYGEPERVKVILV